MSSLFNFYEHLPDELKPKKVKNLGYENHLISSPCRILISGPSSAGKTLSILNYLKLAKEGKRGQYNKITIFTKKNEVLYEFMKLKSPSTVDIVEMCNKDSVIPSIEEFDTTLNHFIIFDDLITSKEHFPAIREMFIRCRKARPNPINICFITQDFRAVDSMIRKNCNYFWVFRPSTEREKRIMYQDLPLLDNKELWAQLEKKDNPKQPSNFINYDVDKNKVRINFSKKYFGEH